MIGMNLVYAPSVDSAQSSNMDWEPVRYQPGSSDESDSSSESDLAVDDAAADKEESDEDKNEPERITRIQFFKSDVESTPVTQTVVFEVDDEPCSIRKPAGSASSSSAVAAAAASPCPSTHRATSTPILKSAMKKQKHEQLVLTKEEHVDLQIKDIARMQFGLGPKLEGKIILADLKTAIEVNKASHRRGKVLSKPPPNKPRRSERVEKKNLNRPKKGMIRLKINGPKPVVGSELLRSGDEGEAMAD